MKLFIGTPCFGGNCNSEYIVSLINTIKFLKENGIETHLEFINNESLITRARNRLIANFMSLTDCTHILFIDADIVWNPKDVLKLLNHDKGLIGGIYPIKQYHWGRLNRVNHESNLSDLLNYNLNLNMENQIENNVIQLKHIATGFMMIKRETIAMLKQMYPEKKYKDPRNNDKVNENTYCFFNCEVVNDNYLSEDYYFCYIWSKIDGKIFADLSINLNHIGRETFRGNSIKYIKNLMDNQNNELQELYG
jgi:hypothetical protein